MPVTLGQRSQSASYAGGDLALPFGFTYATLSGTWTSTAQGDYFLLTGVGGDAIRELCTPYLIDNSIPSTARIDQEVIFFEYLFNTGGSNTKIVKVLDNNHILVTIDSFFSSETIMAVTSKYKAPRYIEVGIGKENSPPYQVGIIDMGSSIIGMFSDTVIRDAGDGTLTPFLMLEVSAGAADGLGINVLY